MAKSGATTVQQYLEELSPERREAISAVRDVILAHLPEGYEEGIHFGMIGYVVPLATYPKTYNKQPPQLCRTVLPEELHVPLPDERLRRRGYGGVV